jgi:hypothetical protein
VTGLDLLFGSRSPLSVTWLNYKSNPVTERGDLDPNYKSNPVTERGDLHPNYKSNPVTERGDLHPGPDLPSQ